MSSHFRRGTLHRVCIASAVTEIQEIILDWFSLDFPRNVTDSGAKVTMQEDTFPAAEKILSDIENVVKKDSSLKSFEIIPAEDNENKSPVFHQEACLGLASWCVRPLYCYVYRRLLDLRQNKHRREELSTVARWLFGALLLNPDVSTFWNMRRELVRSHKLDPWEELTFTRLVLYHKPKCFEAFAYRRWLLTYALDTKAKGYDPAPGESPLCAEMEVAGTGADRYANNYHAWSHRRHVMALRESRDYSHPNLESEWAATLGFYKQHVSDYSGLAYRQFLLRKCMLESVRTVSPSRLDAPGSKDASSEELADYLWQRDTVLEYVTSGAGDLEAVDHLQALTRRNAITDVLDSLHGKGHGRPPSEVEQHACFRALYYWVEEAKVNEDSIGMYNDHEALWYHRRFLAHILLRAIASYRKYSSYKDDVVDARTGIRPCGDLEERSTVEDCESCGGGLLVVAFTNRTRNIAEMARKRGNHEETIVKKFVQFLGNVGLRI